MIQTKIELLIRPSIESMGYEFWGCEYRSQGRYSLLRIYIDHARGIGIEDCEKVSRQISALLDVEDPISGNYSLEVSSPGIPRPLFHKEQYQRYIGEEIEIKLSTPLNKRRTFTGRIVSANEHLVLDLGDELGQQSFSYTTIAKAFLTSK
ncbi:MAG TPA: ribosome maturation factor RimP [Legionellaceae bacterium]|nr:ribosome maturation factor RimP [Legionellaceae bacterium]